MSIIHHQHSHFIVSEYPMYSVCPVFRIRPSLAVFLFSIGLASACDGPGSKVAGATTEASGVMYRSGVVIDEAGSLASSTASLASPGQKGQAGQHMQLPRASPMGSALVPGRVLVSGNRAFKVESVESTAEGWAIAFSEPAFEEVFDSIHVGGSAALSSDHVTQVGPQVTLRQPPASTSASPMLLTPNGDLVFSLVNVVALDLDGNPATTFDQVLLNGDITLKQPSIDFKFNWLPSQPPDVKLSLQAGEAANVTVSTPTQAFARSLELPIASFTIPIPGTLGIVAIAGELKLFLDASGSARASVTFTEHVALSAGLIGGGNPWVVTPYSIVDKGFAVTAPTVEGQLRASAALGPELSLMVLQYDVAGMNARLGVQALADSVASPTRQCFSVDLEGFFAAYGYVQIPGYRIDQELYRASWPIYANTFCH